MPQNDKRRQKSLAKQKAKRVAKHKQLRQAGGSVHEPEARPETSHNPMPLPAGGKSPNVSGMAAAHLVKRRDTSRSARKP